MKDRHPAASVSVPPCSVGSSALFQGHFSSPRRDPDGEELRPPAKAKRVTVLGKDPFVPVKPSGDGSPGQNLGCSLMRDPKPQPLN